MNFYKLSINYTNLKEKSFAIEIEITMKLAKKVLKFYEVGFSYNGRTFEEGKKIKMKDGKIIGEPDGVPMKFK